MTCIDNEVQYQAFRSNGCENCTSSLASRQFYMSGPATQRDIKAAQVLAGHISHDWIVADGNHPWGMHTQRWSPAQIQQGTHAWCIAVPLER
jgi:hypothetical protein